jgi:hypothetical protein
MMQAAVLRAATMSGPSRMVSSMATRRIPLQQCCRNLTTTSTTTVTAGRLCLLAPFLSYVAFEGLFLVASQDSDVLQLCHHHATKPWHKQEGETMYIAA